MFKHKRNKKISKLIILIIILVLQIPLIAEASQEAKNLSNSQLSEGWYWDDYGNGYINGCTKITSPAPTVTYLDSKKKTISKSSAVVDGCLQSSVKYIRITWEKTGSNVFMATNLKVYVPSKDKNNISGLNFGFSNNDDGTTLRYVNGNGGTGTTIDGTQADGKTTWTISATESNIEKLKSMDYLCVDGSTESGQHTYVGAYMVYTPIPDIVIDNTPPTASIEASTESWTKDSVELTLKAQDGQSGLSNMTLEKKVDNNWITIETYTFNGEKDEQTKKYILTNEQSSQEYRVTATDKKGQSVQTSSVNINIDKTVPTTNISLSDNYATSNTSSSLSGLDTMSGLTSLTVQTSTTGDFNSNCSEIQTFNYKSSKTEKKETYKVNPTVKTYYRIKATDLAGNIGYSASALLEVDNTKPTMNVEPQSQSYKNNNIMYYKDSLSPKGIGYDDESGIDSLYFIKETNPLLYDSSTSNPWTRNNTYTADTIDLLYYCTDKAGNESKRNRFTYYVDKTSPAVNYCILDVPQVDGVVTNNYSNKDILIYNSGLQVFPEFSNVSVAGGEKWVNYDCFINISAKDTQTGLNRFILQKYVNNQWLDYNIIKANAEVENTLKSFTISEYGSYRVAVYDNFDHVTYTSDTKSYIDKVAPQITLEKEVYGWTKDNVTIKAQVTDDLSGIKSFVLINQKSGINVAEGNISDDLLSANIKFEECSEGITKFLAVATDYSGNISKKEITVKIDKTAPNGEVNCNYDGYVLDIDISNIVEKHSGCDRAWVEVSDVNNEIGAKTYELTLTSGNNINDGASYHGSATLDQDFTMCDSVLTAIKIQDKVGNIRTLQSQTYDVFKLEGYIERNLGQADFWKRGETGIVHANASAYVDNVEIIFPDEFIEEDDSLADINYEYNGSEYIAVIGHDFTIPLYVENNTYTVTIRAYKNGRMKEINPYINANGSILDTIRRRVRYNIN